MSKPKPRPDPQGDPLVPFLHFLMAEGGLAEHPRGVARMPARVWVAEQQEVLGERTV